MSEPPLPTDPRVYFSAERTLLAWLRTGLAILGIGFLVARFGLFVQLLKAPGTPPTIAWASTTLGVAFVLVGSAAIAMAAWQHGRFSRGLPVELRPADYSMRWSLWLAFAVAAMGLLLAGYLVWTSSPGHLPSPQTVMASLTGAKPQASDEGLAQLIEPRDASR
jgi:putative membrane protein